MSEERLTVRIEPGHLWRLPRSQSQLRMRRPRMLATRQLLMERVIIQEETIIAETWAGEVFAHPARYKLVRRRRAR